jgi:hypothetical protein
MEKPDQVSIGAALHTALRRVCTSLPASIAWNLITVMPTETWDAYVSEIQQDLKARAAVSQDEIMSSVKTSSLKLAARWQDGYGVILREVFELFSLQDWDAYVAFLVDTDFKNK